MTFATRSVWLAFGAMMLLGIGCAPEDDRIDDVAAAEEQLLSADPLPAEVVELLARHHRGRPLTAQQLDKVYELHHYVRVGRNRRVHVTETFTLRSWLQWPHRGVLMLSGPNVLGNFYNLDVDGYRFQDELAQEGMFAFAADYEGYGDSTHPLNGYDVTHDYLVDSIRPVIGFIRLTRMVPRVDLLGESEGAAVAAELCADGWAVRSCVLASVLYREASEFFNAVFLDPAFVFFLSNQPNGYLNVTPDFYFNIVGRMSPEVQAVALSTQPGVYALGPVMAPIPGLPWFDPTHARVPALIINGTEDNIPTPNDADLLAEDYGSAVSCGGHAEIVRIEGGGHIPRVEPPPVSDAWEAAVLEFLDP